MISGHIGHSETRIDHGAQKTGNAKNCMSQPAGARSASAKALELTLENNVCGRRTVAPLKLTILMMFAVNAC